MMLNLSHKKLPVYQASLALTIECYKILKLVPSEERYGLTLQIKRAVTSVHLNIAEGSSKKSPIERKRFYEMARSSAVEVDAAFELLVVLGLIDTERLDNLAAAINTCFQQLSNLINHLKLSQNS